MATTTETFAWSVLAAAGQEAATEKRDGLASECSLINANEKAHGKGGKPFKGGQNFPVEIAAQEHTGITQFTDGFDLFDAQANEVERVALFPLCTSGLLMKIGVQENYLLGQTAGALRSKVQTLTQACMSFLMRQWEKRILAATGAGFGSWITLNGIDSTAGVFEQDALLSQTNTIGGLSKSTYASVVAWQNKVANMGSAFGTNWHALKRLIIQTKDYKADGKKSWFMTENALVNIERFVQSYVRYAPKGDESMSIGHHVGSYMGHPVYQNTRLPTSGANTTTYPMSVLLLDHDDIFWAFAKGTNDTIALPDGYFGTGKWGPIGGLQSLVAGCPMMVVGNTIVAAMGSSGLAYAGETF